jgi:uncharacterized glyoxalase superfamily protein PhnB
VTDHDDPLEPLRELRPDRPGGDEPNDPWILAEERDRLMSVIENTPVEPKPAWHTPAIYARLGYEDEHAAVEFLTSAFGFHERAESRMVHDDGHMLAWLEHDDGIVMVGHVNHDVHGVHSPQETGAATCVLMVSVTDVDAHHDRSVAAGVRITYALHDAFWGDRFYEAEDLEGNRWHFGEPLSSVRKRRGEPEEE